MGYLRDVPLVRESDPSHVGRHRLFEPRPDAPVPPISRLAVVMLFALAVMVNELAFQITGTM